MTSPHLRLELRTRPLVAVLCSVPLVGEAVSGALEFAGARSFAAGEGALEGLLASLGPDALIVDSVAGAEAAPEFARPEAIWNTVAGALSARGGPVR